MGKFSIDPFVVRQSFSHARTKPVVVEKVKRRTAASTVLLCPSCGAKMQLVREPKITASCPHCSGINTQDNK
jgi:Zn finger protein HypA/HybF involved in hydrogenase expression